MTQSDELKPPLCVFDKFGKSYWYSLALTQREVKRSFLYMHTGKAKFWPYWGARGFKIQPAKIVKLSTVKP